MSEQNFSHEEISSDTKLRKSVATIYGDFRNREILRESISGNIHLFGTDNVLFSLELFDKFYKIATEQDLRIRILEFWRGLPDAGFAQLVLRLININPDREYMVVKINKEELERMEEKNDKGKEVNIWKLFSRKTNTDSKRLESQIRFICGFTVACVGIAISATVFYRFSKKL